VIGAYAESNRSRHFPSILFGAYNNQGQLEWIGRSEISTLSVSKDQRGSNVYIDIGQNDYADTLAAPYCIRPYHRATVSAPLQWKEIRRDLDRFSFNMDTIQKRLKQKGDLFKSVLSVVIGKKNSAILKTL
jgi:bifunctional non-homologous end joining protein LigD